MITINNLLLFFYDIININTSINENEYFLYNNSTYILKKINNFSIDNLLNIKDNRFHTIIKNKYNNYTSLFENNYYILLKVNINTNNREINIDDIIKISKINSYVNISKNNYFLMWKNKSMFFETYSNDYYKNDNYDFNYYNGLAYNALNIIKELNNLDLSYGITYRRFYDIKSLYDLYDPFNIEYGPVVNSYAEYIKYMFFYKQERVDYKKILSINLNIVDYYYFVARLLYPTYYYDLFKNERIRIDYKIIESLICDYIVYVKNIIYDIKKRHNDMSLLDIISNQF